MSILGDNLSCSKSGTAERPRRFALSGKVNSPPTILAFWC